MKRLLLVCVLASCFPAMALAQPRESAGKDATLASLVAELSSNNPMLAAARREVDMRVARIAPAGTPPDPTLSIGYMSGFARPPFFPSSSTPVDLESVLRTSPFNLLVNVYERGGVRPFAFDLKAALPDDAFDYVWGQVNRPADRTGGAR